MSRESLKDEIKKRGTFEVPEEEVYLNLARTLDHLRSGFMALFKAHGISEAQYNALRILRGAGELPCLEVAARMITRLPDITRLVDRLEEAGLVVRSRTDQDRRVVLIAVTDRGLRLLADLDEPVRQLLRRQLGHLAGDEQAELNRLLVRARRPDPA